MSKTANARVKAKQTPITAPEALAMLTSAVNYCQQAGLEVELGMVEGRLILAVAGAEIAETDRGLTFVAAQEPEHVSEAGQVADAAV